MVHSSKKAVRALATAVMAWSVIESSLATSAAAQAPRTNPRAGVIRPRSFCIQGAPAEKCRSFLILELPVGATARSYSRDMATGDAYAALEIGAMFNRTETHAIGATFAGGTAAGDTHFSLNARSRTWFSERTYRDLSLGVVALGPTGGITGTVGSGYRDIIGAWVGSDFAFIGGKPRATLRAGGRLGAYPTLGVLGVAIAALALGGGIKDY